MQIQQQVATNPSTKLTDFGCESDRWLLASPTTIAIYYYYYLS